MTNDKFKALVHYVCDYCIETPGKLGATKLNKILWFSDVAAYVYLGKPLTSEEYIKRQFGPVPMTILPTLEELEGEGKLSIRDISSYGYRQRLFLSSEKADNAAFSDDELSLIDNIIDCIVHEQTASSISEISHNEAWKAARIGETIPHHAFFASKLGEINEHDMKWAQETLRHRQPL